MHFPNLDFDKKKKINNLNMHNKYEFDKSIGIIIYSIFHSKAYHGQW